MLEGRLQITQKTTGFFKKKGWSVFVHSSASGESSNKVQGIFLQPIVEKCKKKLDARVKIDREIYRIVHTREKLKCQKMLPIFAYFHLYSHIFTWIHLYSPIFTYFRLYSQIFTNIHIYSPIFPYNPLFSPNFTNFHLLSPIFTHFDLFSPICTNLKASKPIHDYACYFLYLPSLHYFVNISVHFYLNIKLLYIFQQSSEWAVGKCPQLYLRMLQRKRNEQKIIRTSFLNTLYKLGLLAQPKRARAPKGV